MYSYFTFPTATDTLSEASTWFNPLIDEFWTPISWGLGIAIFGSLIYFVLSWMKHHKN